jgi:hypothetical protein
MIDDAIAASDSKGLTRYASVQSQYNILDMPTEGPGVLDAIKRHNLMLLPYFPLACGLLTGKYKRNAEMPADARLTKTQRLADRYLTETNWARTEKLADFCEAQGKTLVELAVSWLLSRPIVSSVIAGATKPEQIEANVKAADWALTAEDLIMAFIADSPAACTMSYGSDAAEAIEVEVDGQRVALPIGGIRRAHLAPDVCTPRGGRTGDEQRDPDGGRRGLQREGRRQGDHLRGARSCARVRHAQEVRRGNRRARRHQPQDGRLPLSQSTIHAETARSTTPRH